MHTLSDTKSTHNGALVQLVRIHACHAWGHGFESRTHRKRVPKKFGTRFCLYTIPVTRGQGSFPLRYKSDKSVTSSVHTAGRVPKNFGTLFCLCLLLSLYITLSKHMPLIKKIEERYINLTVGVNWKTYLNS